MKILSNNGKLTIYNNVPDSFTSSIGSVMGGGKNLSEEELKNDIYKYVDDDLNFVGDNAEENEQIYNTVSIRHSNVDSLQAEVPSDVAKDIDGVPDGAVYQRTIDGIDYYMDAQGKIHRATK